ncbi:hypothetical protein ACGFYV_37145 [Streptomyces sp. NPDC048297]|uniref:hypothetical protein n=1 Tax=Streptomyces sp. NPDC048297 TaxID=3365531 RepID=UPI00371F2FDB
MQHTDALRLSDGNPAPPLTQLVERGDITWEQAHQRAEQFLVHRRNAIRQAQQSLRVVAENWATVQELAARPDTPYTRGILNDLIPEDRTLVQDLTALA